MKSSKLRCHINSSPSSSSPTDPNIRRGTRMHAYREMRDWMHDRQTKTDSTHVGEPSPSSPSADRGVRPAATWLKRMWRALACRSGRPGCRVTRPTYGVSSRRGGDVAAGVTRNWPDARARHVAVVLWRPSVRPRSARGGRMHPATTCASIVDDHWRIEQTCTYM
jgi:hypothetical protein